METRRPNQNNPFGSFGDAETEVRRPQDVTSDQWVPISTGSGPIDRTPRGTRLIDTDLQVPQPPRKPAPQAQRPISKPNPKRRKKPRRSAKKAPVPPRAQEKQQRSVVQGTYREHLDARARREQEHARRQASRAEEKYQKQRADGKSGDELRLQKAVRARRSKRILAFGIVSAILLVVLIAVASYAFFYGIPVEKISVTGADDTIYSQDDILKECGVGTGSNIFTVWRTRDEISKRLCSSLPYLASVSVAVKFPDTVTLSVTPDTERFIVTMPGGVFCIDRDDKVLSRKEKKLQTGKYALSGFTQQEAVRGELFTPNEENAPRLAKAKQIAAAVDQSGLTATCSIRLADVTQVVLCIDNRVNVYLGAGEDLEKKLPLIAEMYLSKFPAGVTGYIIAKYDSPYFYKIGSMEYSLSS